MGSMNRLGKFGIITVIIIFATLLLIGCTFSYTLDSEAAEQLFGPGSDFHEKMDETFGDGGTLDNIFGRGGEFERALYSKNFPFFWKHFGWIIILSSILALFQLMFFILALTLRSSISAISSASFI